MPSTLEEVLNPQSITVIGASNNPQGNGYNFTRHLLDYGFRGKLYPVNPNYTEVLGIPAYPRVRDIPGNVDFVISCVPAGEVLNMMDDCAGKGIRGMHLFTARFSETGHSEAADLEKELLKKARKYDIRLIGPNCLGVYHPRIGVSFGYDFPHDPGPVGMASQSGGGATGLVRAAALYGVRFSKVISYGNAIDLNESDYLEYFLHDDETRVILMYIEGVRDGRRFFETLKHATAVKPVIVAKGGRGKVGAKAIASHTASMTSSVQVWDAMVRQAGAVPARDFDEMADLAVAFCFLPPFTGNRVGIVGGGGGMSVFSADHCEEAGLDVIPLPQDVRSELRARAPTVWDWLSNPGDVSILGGSGVTGIDLLKMMVRSPEFDLFILNVSDDGPSRKEDLLVRIKTEIQGYIAAHKESRKPLMVVVEDKSTSLDNWDDWRWKESGVTRSALLAAGVPFYPTMERAARAAKKVMAYYRRRTCQAAD